MAIKARKWYKEWLKRLGNRWKRQEKATEAEKMARNAGKRT